MKKLILALILVILLVPAVFSADLVEDLNVVEYGDDARITLPLFSETFVKAHEGTDLAFHISDPVQTRVTLVRNKLTILKITKETTEINLALDGGKAERVVLTNGEEYNVNFNYDFVPNMTIKPIIVNTNKDVRIRNVVLAFDIPFHKDKGDKFGRAPKSFVAIDPTIIEPERKKNNEGLLDPWVFFMAIVIILLLCAIAVLYNKKKK